MYAIDPDEEERKDQRTGDRIVLGAVGFLVAVGVVLVALAVRFLASVSAGL